MSEETEIGTLTVREKLNMPYLLAKQIITFQQAILLPPENSRSTVEEAINGLVELIPDTWKDDEWIKEIEKAKEEIIWDVRPWVAGDVYMNEEACNRLGIPAYVTEEVKNPNKMFHAVVNLLYRKGLMSQITRIEKTLGEGWDGDKSTEG